MANNLIKIAGSIQMQFLRALHAQIVMPSLVNSDFGVESAKKGASISVPFTTGSTASDVVPGVNAPAGEDIGVEDVNIDLSQWKHSSFQLNDKELTEIVNGTGLVNSKITDAVNALVEGIDQYIMSFYKGVYGFVGTAGTTPFDTDASAAIEARKLLTSQKSPKAERRLVLDEDAEAQALGLSTIVDADKRGDGTAKREGEIGRQYGFEWFQDAYIPTHTAGTLTGDPTAAATPAGANAIVIDTDADDAVALVEGDIITVAGHSQTYAVTADAAVGASSSVSVNIVPALKATLVGGEAIAVKGDHVVNLAFHREAFGFVNRINEIAGASLRTTIQSFVFADPLTGLVFRLELIEEYKQMKWDIDILYGAQLVRKDLAVRVAG